MALDAVVYCNCFETGKIRSTPLEDWSVYVDECGARSARTHNLEQDIAFDCWSANACEHEDGILLHHWLGNISLIAFLRECLSRESERLPVILSRIIYTGTHSGDYLPRKDVAELDALASIHAANPNDEPLLRCFANQLDGLVRVAISLSKPIAF